MEGVLRVYGRWPMLVWLQNQSCREEAVLVYILYLHKKMRFLNSLYKQYRCDHCLLLNLQIKFGWQSLYHTRTPASIANIFQYNLSFSKKFLQSKATNWWPNLPITLISSSATHMNYIITYYIPDCLLRCLFLYIVCVVFKCYCTWLFLW